MGIDHNIVKPTGNLFTLIKDTIHRIFIFIHFIPNTKETQFKKETPGSPIANKKSRN